MWTYHEGYTYRTRGRSDTVHKNKNTTLQSAVCIPPANWAVKSYAFFRKDPYDFRTSLRKTTCSTKSSEDTGLILYLWKGEHNTNRPKILFHYHPDFLWTQTIFYASSLTLCLHSILLSISRWNKHHINSICNSLRRFCYIETLV